MLSALNSLEVEQRSIALDTLNALADVNQEKLVIANQAQHHFVSRNNFIIP